MSLQKALLAFETYVKPNLEELNRNDFREFSLVMREFLLRIDRMQFEEQKNVSQQTTENE